MSRNLFLETPKNNISNLFSDNFILDKGSILFKQGDKIDYIYILTDGELSILKNNQFMWQAQCNEFIGISSFFIGDSHYSYSVKACNQSTVARIAIKDFKKALNNHPALNTYLMKLFCDRIDFTLAKVSTRSRLTRKKRLINILIEKTKKLENKKKLVLNYSIADIAEFGNVSQKFAKELLNELQNNGLIKLQKNIIEIIDFTGLKLVSRMK
jgi:CRP-like cAMP-binding protein